MVDKVWSRKESFLFSSTILAWVSIKYGSKSLSCIITIQSSNAPSSLDKLVNSQCSCNWWNADWVANIVSKDTNLLTPFSQCFPRNFLENLFFTAGHIVSLHFQACFSWQEPMKAQKAQTDTYYFSNASGLAASSRISPRERLLGQHVALGMASHPHRQKLVFHSAGQSAARLRAGPLRAASLDTRKGSSCQKTLYL